MLTTGEIILRRFTVGWYPINGYLLADSETRIGAFIDPGGFQDEIADFIEQRRIQLRYLFFTHGHSDHTGGLKQFKSKYSVKCCAGAGEVRAANEILQHETKLEIGHLCCTALSTPGHTKGGFSFYCEDCVFTGDALFCGSVGGTSGKAAEQQQLEHIRKNIFSLPDHTLVFPAHGPMSTVAAEKYANPFLAQ